MPAIQADNLAFSAPLKMESGKPLSPYLKITRISTHEPDIWDKASILESRKSASGDDSYVASLYEQGLDKILEKVGEEAVETILAAKDAYQSGNNEKLIYETADLWFHSLHACHLGEDAKAVQEELGSLLWSIGS